MSLLLESKDVASEDLDDAFREIDEFIESWDNKLTLDNPAFTKRYPKGELIILLDQCCISDSSGNTKKFRIIFQGIPIDGAKSNSGKGDWRTTQFQCDGTCRGDSHVPMGGLYREEQSVLVRDVELMNSPEVFVPSLIWFQSLNEPDSFGTGSLYFSKSLGFKRVPAVTNWEVSFDSGGFSISNEHLTCEQVERRSQIKQPVVELGSGV